MLKLELLFGLAVRTPLLLLVAAAAGMSVGWSKAAELAWPTIVLRVAPVFLTFATLWSVGSIWQTLARMKRGTMRRCRPGSHCGRLFRCLFIVASSSERCCSRCSV